MKAAKYGLYALCMAPAIALADGHAPVLYGKIHASAAYLSQDDGTEANSFAITSHGSRLGVKGHHELTEKMSAVYKLEFGIDTTDNNKGSNDNIKSRDQYVGVQKGDHLIRLGRISNPHKVALSKIDPQSDTFIDATSILSVDNRDNDAINYSFKGDNGFSFGLAYTAGDDSVTDENAMDGFSGALGYKFAAGEGNLELGASFDQRETTPMDDTTAIKFGAIYSGSKVTAGLVAEIIDDGSDDDTTELFGRLSFDVDDTNELHLVFGTSDDGSDDNATMYGISAHHKYAKSTKSYVLLGGSTDGGLASKGKLNGDGLVVAVGMIHSF